MQTKIHKKLSRKKETLTALQLANAVGGGSSQSGCTSKPQWSCGDCSRLPTACLEG